MNSNLIFHQLFEKESSTFTYLLGDKESKEAIIIDPVSETAERDLKLIQELGLKLKYILETHVHADHVTGSDFIRSKTGAQIGVSVVYDMACPDLHLENGQELKFGQFIIRAMATPGHTDGCLTYVMDKMAFTGDALLIRGCGRTDFQGGSSEKLFHSVRDGIFSLSDDTLIWPAHDYKGQSHSSVEMEKNYNPRLNLKINKEQFKQIMSDLKLDYPKKIQESVPANLHCGVRGKFVDFKNELINGMPTITPEEVQKHLGVMTIVDVRGTDEYHNELGHIPGSILATLGPDLEEGLKRIPFDQQVVFVCRSGKRSAQATDLAMKSGFNKVFNMQGGMLKWNELHFSTER